MDSYEKSTYPILSSLLEFIIVLPIVWEGYMSLDLCRFRDYICVLVVEC
jgi:hypothetical protein